MIGVLLQLGSFQFSIKTAAYDSLRRRTEYRWAAQERLDRPPARQFLGSGDDEIELSGIVYPHYKGGIKQIETLRKLAGTGKEQRMVAMPSINHGIDMGLWCVEEVTEEQSFFTTSGVPRKQAFTLRISAYGEDAE